MRKAEIAVVLTVRGGGDRRRGFALGAVGRVAPDPGRRDGLRRARPPRPGDGRQRRACDRSSQSQEGRAECADTGNAFRPLAPAVAEGNRWVAPRRWGFVRRVWSVRPDVVQPWMPRAARDSDACLLAREHRGWREAPRMCRSRCIGIRRQAPRRHLRLRRDAGRLRAARRRGVAARARALRLRGHRRGPRGVRRPPYAHTHAYLAERAASRTPRRCGRRCRASCSR